MTNLNEIYKCEICGNIVEVLHRSIGILVCCGVPMSLVVEKREDKGQEKHVPVIEGNKVKVGSVEHPMEKEHYIEWIEVISGGKACRKFLKPGDKPELEFEMQAKIKARCYCNLHGLWKK